METIIYIVIFFICLGFVLKWAFKFMLKNFLFFIPVFLVVAVILYYGAIWVVESTTNNITQIKNTNVISVLLSSIFSKSTNISNNTVNIYLDNVNLSNILNLINKEENNQTNIYNDITTNDTTIYTINNNPIMPISPGHNIEFTSYFVMEDTGVAEITLTHNENISENNLWHITLYSQENKDFNPILVYDIKAEQQNFQSSKIGLSKGLYYVSLKSYTEIKKPYSLSIFKDYVENYEKEINNSPSLATPISLDNYFNGLIGTTNDMDCYKLSLTEESDITLNLELVKSQSSGKTLNIEVFTLNEMNKPIQNFTIDSKDKFSSHKLKNLKVDNYIIKISSFKSPFIEYVLSFTN